jgi:Arc/MetJ-type ribon-helix-helix transcriptional regulator
VYVLRMTTDTRKQINFRVDDDLLEKIDDLRRWRSPIPSVSDLLRELVEEAHQREGKRRNG